MGAVQLPDELQRVIERQVAEGRAPTPAAFLEEAVLRLVEDARSEQQELFEVAQAGIADIEAGRYTTVATPADSRLAHKRLLARLRARLAAQE